MSDAGDIPKPYLIDLGGPFSMKVRCADPQEAMLASSLLLSPFGGMLLTAMMTSRQTPNEERAEKAKQADIKQKLGQLLSDRKKEFFQDLAALNAAYKVSFAELTQQQSRARQAAQAGHAQTPHLPTLSKGGVSRPISTPSIDR